MRRTRVDLSNLVKSAWDEVRPDPSKREVRFAAAQLPAVQGDAVMLRQAFVNLLSNAVKFTRTREVARIEVDAQHVDGELVVAVRDNGVGFDQSHADKLFGVFQRLHSNDEFEGTGIGLAIVQRVIERHGGVVRAHAEPDHGATFAVHLPRTLEA
jgi:signal transduction histidine kinase